jgi:hypothetical protein
MREADGALDAGGDVVMKPPTSACTASGRFSIICSRGVPPGGSGAASAHERKSNCERDLWPLLHYSYVDAGAADHITPQPFGQNRSLPKSSVFERFALVVGSAITIGDKSTPAR